MKAYKLIIYFFCISSIAAFSQELSIPNSSICSNPGSIANITVRTNEATPIFGWYYKSGTTWVLINSLNAGTVYSNFNTATLTITKSSTLPIAGTSYKVIVTSGATILNSNEAILTIDPLPVIKTITGASAVCAGDNQTLTYGIGSVGTIQWQSSTTSATANDFSNIVGETSEVYTATNLQQTTWYRVRNTSGACDPKYSLVVQVSVYSNPVAGYIDGGDVSVCKSTNSTILNLIDYQGTIQWQKAPDAGGYPGTFINVPLATSDTYTPTNLISSTYYKAIVSSGVCVPVETDPVLIQVDPVSVTKTISGASAVCEGDFLTLTYGAGSVGDIQWQSSTTSATADDFTDLDGETSETYTANYLQQTTWFRVRNSSGVCDPKFSPVVQVPVYSVPVSGYIIGGDVSVCKSSNSTTLSLIGYEGTVQWQRASDAGGYPGTFFNISLANSDSYTATNVLTSTYFKAIVSNGVCVPVETDPVLIQVDPTPVIKTIVGASAVCAGEDLTLTYGGGSVGTIQWQFSTTSATADDFIDIDGATSEVNVATNLQQSTWFRVSNTSGVCETKYSLAVQVLVYSVPSAGYIDGGNISVCKSSNSTTLSLIGYEGTIQWQKAPDVGGYPGTFVNVSLATTDTYTATNLISSAYYKVIVSNGVCVSVETDPVFIQVDPLAVIKTITGATPVCVGGGITLTYGAGSIGDIQWQSSNTSATATDFSPIDGATTEVYTPSNLQQTTWYRVMNTSGVCDPKYSLAVQVQVYQVPVSGYIDGGDVSVCKSSNATTLSLIGYQGAIQWQKAPDAGGFPGTFVNVTLANADTYTAVNLSASAYYKAILSSGVCASVETDSVLIRVDPIAVIKTITGATAVCFGGSQTLTYGSGSVGNIQWQSSTTSATANDFSSIDGATTEVYTPTNLQQTTWYRVMNTSGVCDAKYSLPVQLIVNPASVAGIIQGGNISVCKSSNSTTLSLIGYQGSIQWQKAPDMGGFPGTFVSISLATSDSYTAANLISSAYYKAIVSSGVCVKVSTEPVRIYVDPLSVSKTITGASAVCAGGSKMLTYGTGSVGSIQWQSSITSATALDFIAIDGATSEVYTPTNLQQTTWFRVVNTSGVCGPVYSPAVQVLVTSNTTPTFTQVAPICSGTTLAPLPTKSINGISGTWSPPINNTLTTTYTFTPNIGVCANSTTMTIYVNNTEPPIGVSVQNFNMTVPKTISDLVVSGSNISWFGSLANALSNTLPLGLNTNLVQGNKYYAMQTVNGCRSISPIEVLVNSTLGTSVFDSKELQFFPNPVEDYFTLIYSEIISDVQLFSTSGESVFISHPNSFKTILNLNYLSSGIYFVEVKANTKKSILKIVKK